MTIIIDGVDITTYIEYHGISWSLNSLDADGAGRNLNGQMQRKLVAFKNKFEIKCRQLTNTQRDSLTTLLSKDWLTVQVVTNSGTSSYTMYPGSAVKSAILVEVDGMEMWEGFSFSLIER